MKFENELKELVQKEVISQLIADDISKYYENKSQSNPSTILIAFGIIGAIIGGLGIILILAHNWDMMGVWLKTIIAFIPLLIGQFLCGYTLFKKRGNMVWQESSAIFLFIAIGACISLISQTYHIDGDLASFLVSWMLLGLPLIYLMKSSSATVLYIMGITYYAAIGGYNFRGDGNSYYYWLLLIAIIPHLYSKHKASLTSNSLTIIYWVFSLSVIITLGTVLQKEGILMFLTYFSLFGLLYNFGHSKWMIQNKFLANGPRILGGIGILGLFFFFSFNFIWNEMLSIHHGRRGAVINWETAYYSPEFVFCVILSAISVLLLVVRRKTQSWDEMRPMGFMPFIFMIVFALGYYWTFSQLVINLLILLIGVLTIIEGSKKNNLGILNKGLTVIMILTICRFFDTNLSFVLKGLMFMVVGAGFVIANYLVVRNRKNRIN